MMIQVTQSGNSRRFHVEQVEFVQHCHYLKCGEEFLTIDPDQVYCKDSHRKNAWRLRQPEDPRVSIPALALR